MKGALYHLWTRNFDGRAHHLYDQQLDLLMVTKGSLYFLYRK